MPPKKQADKNYNPEVFRVEEYKQERDIYWHDVGNEQEIFRRAVELQLPLVFKGPTGTGKTTFARKMQQELGAEFTAKKFKPAYQLNQESGLYEPNQSNTKQGVPFPLYIVDGTEGCEEFHLIGGENAAGKWIGGPLYHWAHTGGICLVNEIAEIRSDVQTIFHSILDDDRSLSIPDLAQVVHLPEHGIFVAGYNPGYQTKKEPIKISTKHRLPCIEFSYPVAEVEAEIIQNAASWGKYKADKKYSEKLANFAALLRSDDRDSSILSTREGVSTRLLVRAARWVAAGGESAEACRMHIVNVLADNKKEAEGLEEILHASGLL
jgi:nitric oxide reductase NorQ protein